MDGGDTVTGPPSFNQIDHVRAGQRDHTRLADIACPLTESPRRGLTTWWPNLPRLTECAERRVLVVSNGHLTGIITPSDIT